MDSSDIDGWWKDDNYPEAKPEISDKYISSCLNETEPCVIPESNSDNGKMYMKIRSSNGSKVAESLSGMPDDQNSEAYEKWLEEYFLIYSNAEPSENSIDDQKLAAETEIHTKKRTIDDIYSFEFKLSDNERSTIKMIKR